MNGGAERLRPKGGRATIYDIARVAGVSIATVSLVLSGKGRASAATRERIFAAVRELGYERSAIASALAGKNTHTIGLLVPDVDNPFFSEVVRGAEDAAFARGYSVLIGNTDHDRDKESAYLRTMRVKAMDGVIVATGTADPAVLSEMAQDGVRVALLSRQIPGVLGPYVGVDNRAGGYEAAAHLLALGHRSIGVVVEPLSIQSARDRLDGFLGRMAQTSDVEVRVAREEGFGIRTGELAARTLLQEFPASAIFAGNDQLAIGVLQAARSLGLRVPEDLSVIGFDDSAWARIAVPALTTIAQPMRELGQTAADLVIDQIEGGADGSGMPDESPVILPFSLVVRESTGYAKIRQSVRHQAHQADDRRTEVYW